MTDPNAMIGRTGTTAPAGAHTAPTEQPPAARVVPPVTGDPLSDPTAPAGYGTRAAERIEAWTDVVTSHPLAARLERAVTGAADRLLPAGSSLRDVLSGSWLGQSLHPMLNDVPTGLWTS